MKKYEVTCCDTGKTVVLTLKEAVKKFGKNEFKEIVAGYLPHLIAVELFSTVNSCENNFQGEFNG
jgi:uncharacterized membrane protein (DUF373 family)